MSLHNLEPRQPLTDEQREHWESQLAIAERAVQYAQRMLGIVTVEKMIERGE